METPTATYTANSITTSEGICAKFAQRSGETARCVEQDSVAHTNVCCWREGYTASGLACL